MSNPAKTKIFLDGLPLADRKMSGIGHLVLETVYSLIRDEDFNKKYELNIVLPLFKKKKVIRNMQVGLKYKTIPIPARLLAYLEKIKFLPPIDMVLGQGAYIFPNYRNWPLRRSQSITYFHDISYRLYPETLTKKNLQYLKANSDRWTARADVIVTLTDSSKKDITEHLNINSKKIYVVPCGINSKTYYRRPMIEVETAKHKYGIKSEKYFIFVGNLEPRKNINSVLSALSSINDSSIPPLVIVGGQGWNNEDTLNKIENLKAANKVIVPDSYVVDNDIPALISGATALIFPSLYEGFGMPTIEAVACGTLPLVSDIAVFRELFGNALEPWYFSSHDPHQIKTKLIEAAEYKKIIKDKQIKLLQEKTKRYNWDISAKKLTDILDLLN